VAAALSPWPIVGASAERPRPVLAHPIRKAKTIRTATFPRWNRVLLPIPLLGSETDLTFLRSAGHPKPTIGSLGRWRVDLSDTGGIR
jgi:hypothetical protein